MKLHLAHRDHLEALLWVFAVLQRSNGAPFDELNRPVTGLLSGPLSVLSMQSLVPEDAAPHSEGRMRHERRCGHAVEVDWLDILRRLQRRRRRHVGLLHVGRLHVGRLHVGVGVRCVLRSVGAVAV